VLLLNLDDAVERGIFIFSKILNSALDTRFLTRIVCLVNASVGTESNSRLAVSFCRNRACKASLARLSRGASQYLINNSVNAK
jgi:hypothetical protein